tara:strand:+ start:1438 stop:1629 length:192 start_codon:yes stop_codon:yes gene_type:complete
MKVGDLIKFKPSWVPGGFADPCLAVVLRKFNGDMLGDCFVVYSRGTEVIVDVKNHDIQILSSG